LATTVGDGAVRLAAWKDPVDALLIDAYDGRSLAASLATDEFFGRAQRALSAHGVMAMNLWSNDRVFDRNLQRIERAFAGRCLCLPAERPGNVIVFAFADRPQRLRWTELLDQASGLENRFGLEFRRFVGALRQMNRHDPEGLQLANGSA
jgi:spermidine synthase